MRKTTLRCSVALATAVVTSLALSACASGTGDSPAGDTDDAITVPGESSEVNDQLNKLYTDAIDSGNTDVVVYSASATTQKAFHDVFSRRFPGINIIPQDAADSVNITKLETEAQSGSRIADLYMGGGAAVRAAAAEPDICTPADIFTAPEEDLKPLRSANDLTITYAFRNFVFVYNPDMVSEADAPKSWDDLLDPKWKGKILASDPTVLGATRYIFADLLYPEQSDTWGEDYLTKLAAQDLQIASSEPNIPAEVASGRFPIGIGVFNGFYRTQKEKGVPIEQVFPLTDGGNFFTAAGLCTIKDAPHEDATALFVNWMYSEEGQKALAEEDHGFGSLPGSPGPDGVASREEAGSLPLSNTDPVYNEPYFATIDKLFLKS